MASQSERKKRRVRADAAAQRHAAAVARRAQRRRIVVGTFVGLLALAMIAPLAAGILTATTGGNDDPAVDATPELPLTTLRPGLVDEGFEGAILTGTTPCPVTDGTQQRTTSFGSPPPTCIDAAAEYAVALGTPGGPVGLSLDPAASPDAANLVVTLARYGVYEDAPISVFDGLVVVGGFGDAGFVIQAEQGPADGTYPVGSVVALADLDGVLNGQILVVTSEAGAAALAVDPTSPIIGTVGNGLENLDTVAELAAADPTLDLRVASTVVVETPVASAP